MTLPTPTIPWAVLTDVPEVTGVTVDAPTLQLAKQAIELATGAIEVVPRVYLSRRDYYWLKLAVCYQAAWLTAQPDYLTRLDITTISQDGASTSGNADWLKLSPMARGFCKRLSWKGTRTLAPRPMAVPSRDGHNPLAGNRAPLPRYIGFDPTVDGSDDFSEWSPL